MQIGVPTTSLPPATILDALLLQVSASSHRGAVQAVAPQLRAIGLQLLAACDPADLVAPLAGAPLPLSADARMARILRGH